MARWGWGWGHEKLEGKWIFFTNANFKNFVFDGKYAVLDFFISTGVEYWKQFVLDFSISQNFQGFKKIVVNFGFLEIKVFYLFIKMY